MQVPVIASLLLVYCTNVIDEKGKSSLLYSISSTSPRIASYPFTTLQPSIGNAHFTDGRYVSVCDIPGIIEGAHANVGLGLEFLRHIERTKLLCYVIDGTPDAQNKRAAQSTFDMLRAEVKAYDGELMARESVVVCNKMDMEGASATLEALEQHCGLQVFGVSCKTRKGLAELLLYCHSKVIAMT
jgi:GTP-binding protein